MTSKGTSDRANNVGHRHFRPSGAAISRDTREGPHRPLERLLR